MRMYRGFTEKGKEVKGWLLEKTLKNHSEPKVSFIVDSVGVCLDIGYPTEITDFHAVEVIPSTVGQSTGLLDKSGVEIFEGDILDVHPNAKCKGRFLRTVTWNEDYAQFQAPYSDGSGIELFTKRQCLTYEIVGNIHTKGGE